MTSLRRFSPDVARSLDYYVYLYLDPDTGEVFYVGKGRGNRAFEHLRDTSESEKVERIRKLRESGKEPAIEILRHGLKDERTAYKVEAAAIDLIGTARLTNQIRGDDAAHGRMPVEQAAALYGAKEIEIVHPALLIRINKLFRYGMTHTELYNATRGIWRVGARREDAKYAMAVFEGVIHEVYEIRAWFPAGSTLSSRGDLHDSDRWEFVGALAPTKIRNRYRYKAVRSYLPSNSQNPVRYVRC